MTIKEGGGDILPTELSHITKRDAKAGCRLACQVAVKQNMKIELPEEIFGVKNGSAKLSPMITKPLSLKSSSCGSRRGGGAVPRGGYIQIECPPHKVAYADFDVPDEYRSDWDKFNLFRYVSEVKEPTLRAYSMANYPEEGYHYAQRAHCDAAAEGAGCPAGDHVVLYLVAEAGR